MEQQPQGQRASRQAEISRPVTHLLAFHGKTGPLCTLLQAEPLLGQRCDVVGCTPLHWACAGGQLSAIRVLILFGSSPFATDLDGNTPLHVAAKYGHLSACLEVLDASGLQLLHVQNVHGKTPGECAADAKHWKVCQELERLYDIFLAKFQRNGATGRQQQPHGRQQSGLDGPVTASTTTHSSHGGSRVDAQGKADTTTAAAERAGASASESQAKQTAAERSAALRDLSEVAPYRERSLRPGRCHRRLPGLACLVWLAIVAAALRAVQTEPQLPTLAPSGPLGRLLVALWLLIPVVLLCFAAASVADGGIVPDSELQPFVLELSKQDDAPCAASAAAPDAAAAFASEAHPASSETTSTRARSGGDGVAEYFKTALQACQWHRICVARRAVMPGGLGYDRTTGHVVAEYSCYAPLVGNVIGAGNWVAYYAAYLLLLGVSGAGTGVASVRAAALIDAVGFADAVWTWLYVANAALMLSAAFCLSPLLSGFFDILMASERRSALAKHRAGCSERVKSE